MNNFGIFWVNFKFIIKEYSINGSIRVSKAQGRCSNHLALVIIFRFKICPAPVRHRTVSALAITLKANPYGEG